MYRSTGHRSTGHRQFRAFTSAVAAGACLLVVCGACGVEDVGSSSDEPTTTAAPEPIHLVGLGDSIPGALNCIGCTGYVARYGELLESELDRPVEVQNLATNDSLTSPELVERVKSDPAHREALADADIVTLHIGLNDLDPLVCRGYNETECWDALETRTADNVATILDEVIALRDGQPTALRVSTAFNPYPGSDGTFATDPDWAPFFRTVFLTLAERTCQVATARGAVCIDLIPLLNGPNGDGDGGQFLQPNPDHVHLNQSGHDLVAEAIAEAGTAPLG